MFCQAHRWGFPHSQWKISLHFCSLRKGQSFSLPTFQQESLFSRTQSERIGQKRFRKRDVCERKTNKKKQQHKNASAELCLISIKLCLLARIRLIIATGAQSERTQGTGFHAWPGKGGQSVGNSVSWFQTEGRWELLLMGNGQEEEEKKSFLWGLSDGMEMGNAGSFSLEVHRPGTFICFEWNAVGHFNWSPWVINIHCWVIGSGKLPNPLGVDRLAFVLRSRTFLVDFTF